MPSRSLKRIPATNASQGPPTQDVLRRGSLLLLRFERRLVEPEVVATSPNRIKSPVPVCCGFDSAKLVGERGVDFPSPTNWMPQLELFAIANCSAPPRLTDSRSVGSAFPA
jgi:hypothetical protein